MDSPFASWFYRYLLVPAACNRDRNLELNGHVMTLRNYARNCHFIRMTFYAISNAEFLWLGCKVGHCSLAPVFCCYNYHDVAVPSHLETPHRHQVELHARENTNDKLLQAQLLLCP